MDGIADETVILPLPTKKGRKKQHESQKRVNLQDNTVAKTFYENLLN